MKLIIDMSLSPAWEPLLSEAGHEAIHWSRIGDPRASDISILSEARRRGAIVFTHDLDFGAILAVTGAQSPSVIQTRTMNPAPEELGNIILRVLEQLESALEEGSLVVVEESRSRIRMLPLRR